jgi:hypothetical protein
MTNRSMVKLIHADGFFAPGDAERYVNVISGLNFVEKQYGHELENFNMIFSGLEPIFSKVLGERVVIDNKRSGIFRKPINNVIHFEEFDSLNEWCFVIALQKTTLNLFYHLKKDGEYREFDAKTALDEWKFNYRNMFEWDYHTNILLEPNQGIFFRPWVFHSLEDGLVQYYRLLTDTKFRILVMGLPGSNREKIAKQLNESLPNSELLKSRDIRIAQQDVDFTHDGKMRHVYRMLDFARNSKAEYAIIDMVCPLPEMREILNPDIIIWADDIKQSNIPEVDKFFVPPKLYDLKFKSMPENMEDIIEKILSKRY